MDAAKSRGRTERDSALSEPRVDCGTWEFWGHNTDVSRKTSWVYVVGLAVWLMSPMLLGAGTGGVELNSPVDVPPEPGQLPACVSVHTYDSRSWGGWKTVQSDVWLTGCNNSSGELRVQSGPTCTATSFLGAGEAICTATPDGSKLKVAVKVVYPFST